MVWVWWAFSVVWVGPFFCLVFRSTLDTKYGMCKGEKSSKKKLQPNLIKALGEKRSQFTKENLSADIAVPLKSVGMK